MDYRAIRTKDYKYIHWMHYPDEAELYDLVGDPYETQNLIRDARMSGVVRNLQAQMAQAVLDEDPGLATGQHRALRQALLDRWAGRLELAQAG